MLETIQKVKHIQSRADQNMPAGLSPDIKLTMEEFNPESSTRLFLSLQKLCK